MAGIGNLRVDSGRIEAWMPSGLVPREKWPELISLRADFVKERLPADCRNLVQFVDEAADMYQALGYKTPQELVEKGLELNQEEIRYALDWLRLTKPNQPVTLKHAMLLGRQGRPKRDSKHCSTRFTYGASAHWLARLDRDRPDLATDVRDGKLSVNAAAIQAGFRTRSISIPMDPERAAKLLAKHFTAADLQRLISLLTEG